MRRKAAEPPAAIVRRARAGDLDVLIGLEALFPSDRMSRAGLRRLLASPSAALWVAEVAGRVAGNLVLLTRRNSRRARIYSVAVDPSCRGLGIGTRLVKAAEDHARGLGLAEVSLEVRYDNQGARRLYRRLGYGETARLPAYYDDGADGLRLRKPLDA